MADISLSANSALPREAKRDVGFAPREVHVQVGALQLELDLWVAFAEAAKLRSDESRREHLGCGESNHAFEFLIFARDIAFDAEGFAFDPLRAGQQAVPGLGQHVAVGRSIEEARAKLLFELHQSAADGRGVQR